MPTLDPMAFFDLGCQVTKHVYGIDRQANVLEAMLKVVKDIAEGNLTLVDTPEEIIRTLGDDGQVLADAVPQASREMRAEERAAAKVIWDRFVEISRGE
jgi:hypothetical protein